MSNNKRRKSREHIPNEKDILINGKNSISKNDEKIGKNKNQIKNTKRNTLKVVENFAGKAIKMQGDGISTCKIGRILVQKDYRWK